MDDLDLFCALFQGGRLALSPLDGVFRPWKNSDGTPVEAHGQAWRTACENHLYGTQPIGVYPLMAYDDAFGVHFGVIDWDVGDSDSLIHARNTRAVLTKFDIPSYIEPSRSKGMHLWVFPSKIVAATIMRDALLAACEIVSAPTDEINPKQVVMTDKGWGNGIRLPYPKGHKDARQMFLNPSGAPLSLSDALLDMYEARPPSESFDVLAELKKPPPPPLPPIAYKKPSRSHYGTEFIGTAKEVWNHGPRNQGQHTDRSKMLYAFAGSLAYQGYEEPDIIVLTEECDLRWGRKYSDRADGRLRVTALVRDAAQKAGRPIQQRFDKKETEPF